MYIRIGFEITLNCPAETPFLLALGPHPSVKDRIIGSCKVKTTPEIDMEEFLDVFGNRRTRIIAPQGSITITSDCIVENDGKPDVFNWNARQHEVGDLPAETLTYLLASRYCESDELAEQAWDLFKDTPPGWARVQAISNWVHNHITFGYQFGRPTKTAGDALLERTGVCRDFAHLAIALCRALNIPARYASGYLGDIGIPPSGPGDFCAWIEVFLENQWYTFDARYNTPRIGRVLMAHGRDAADAAMITSFGSYGLTFFRVWAEEIKGSYTDADLLDLLRTLPDAPALTLAPT